MNESGAVQTTEETSGQVLRDRCSRVRELSEEVRNLAIRLDVVLLGASGAESGVKEVPDQPSSGLVRDSADTLNEAHNQLQDATEILGKILAQLE